MIAGRCENFPIRVSRPSFDLKIKVTRKKELPSMMNDCSYKAWAALTLWGGNGFAFGAAADSISK